MDKQFRDQLSLFEQSASQALQMPVFERFEVPDADILFCKDFYTPAESEFFFLRLLEEVSGNKIIWHSMGMKSRYHVSLLGMVIVVIPIPILTFRCSLILGLLCYVISSEKLKIL